MSIIDLKLRKVDRNWTRQQYKTVDRWRRECRRIINKRLETIDFGSIIRDKIIYG